jgi:hypothetical protein
MFERLKLRILIFFLFFTFVCFRWTTKWNCCNIRGPICSYWIIFITRCTIVYRTKPPFIMARNLISYLSVCWAFQLCRIDLRKSRIRYTIWSSMSAIMFVLSSFFYLILVSVYCVPKIYVYYGRRRMYSCLSFLRVYFRLCLYSFMVFESSLTQTLCRILGVNRSNCERYDTCQIARTHVD